MSDAKIIGLTVTGGLALLIAGLVIVHKLTSLTTPEAAVAIDSKPAPVPLIAPQRLLPPIQKASPQPPPPEYAAPSHAKLGTITGAAWLNKSDGSSNVQRGLHVSILKSMIARPIVVDCLKDVITDWERFANDCDNSAKSTDTFPYRKVWADDADAARAKIDSIKNLIARLPAEMTVAEAFQAVTDSSHCSIEAGLAEKEATAKADSIRLRANGDVIAALNKEGEAAL